MQITAIHAFLVSPNKGADDPITPRCRTIQLNGSLYDLLRLIFDNAENECDIEIAFRPAEDGSQYNPIREQIMAHAAEPSEQSSLTVITSLANVTTRRSGLGLTFIIHGQDNTKRAVLISRFPTDKGILANERDDGGLDVQFLERVFMKSRNSYKAAYFTGRIGENFFWEGRVVDKQINSVATDASGYWVYDFLQADFKTTGVHGTKRLARALRSASDALDLEAKKELHHVVALSRNLNGRQTSVQDFLNHFAVSAPVRDAVLEAIPNGVSQDRFIFNADEFGRTISVRTVTLDNGAVLSAPSHRFDEVFETKQAEGVEGGMDVIKMSTEGRLLSDQLRKRS